MKRHHIIISLLILIFSFGNSYAASSPFGMGGESTSEEGGLGSTENNTNTSFLQGSGTTKDDPYVQGDDFRDSPYGMGTSPTTTPPLGPGFGWGFYKLFNTAGGFKEGDYVKLDGVVYILQSSGVYPYLVPVPIDGAGNPDWTSYGPALGGQEPYFLMPLGDSLFPLFALLGVFGIVKIKRRSFKTKK